MDIFVCKNSLKFLWYSTSLSPILTYSERPFLYVARVTVGMSTASMLSPMFSMSTLVPFSMAFSMMSAVFGAPMRTTCRLFFASRSLIHAMPCSCGSHIRGQRSELQVMVPFSMDVRSEGKPSPTHPAIVAGSTRTFSTSMPSVIGIPFSTMFFWNADTSSLRNCAVNGPEYVTNAAANRQSPTSTPASILSCATVFFHCSPDAASAFTSRFASPSLMSSFAFSSMAPFFSASASSNWRSRSATSAFRFATFSCTAASLVFASSSCAFASASSWRFGSIIVMTSKYLMMLMANSHKPAAARDLL